jgi:hypothetical protein
VLWGLTSLVKPVTLVIPFFFAPLILIRWRLRPAIRSIVLIVLGMILVVGPYVGRNYLITGQPIVTAQGGIRLLGDIDREDRPERTIFGLAADLVEVWNADLLESHRLCAV